MTKLPMTKLRLLARTPEDIPLIASSVQDSILRVGDVRFDRKARYVTLRLTRYRHEADKPARIEAGLRIDGVMSFQSQGIDTSNPDALAVLLDVTFDPIDKVAGIFTLTFSGGGAMRLEVEAVDITLADTGEPRATKSIPQHEG